MNDLFIGLDLGAVHFGYAVLRADGTRESSGVWNLPTARSGQRWFALRAHLEALVSHWRLLGTMDVAYENVRRHEGVLAAHAYGGALAIVQLVLSSFQVLALVPLEVAEVKRAATGKGNADKEWVQRAARAHWGEAAAATEDEADALWIAEVARRRAIPESLEAVEMAAPHSRGTVAQARSAD